MKDQKEEIKKVATCLAAAKEKSKDGAVSR